MKYEVMLSQFQVPFSAHRSSFPGHFFGRLSIGFSTVFSTYDKHKLGKIVQLRYEDRRQISKIAKF